MKNCEKERNSYMIHNKHNSHERETEKIKMCLEQKRFKEGK